MSLQLPMRVDDLLKQGVAYGLAKEFDRAQAALQHAAELAPDSAEVHFNLGVAQRNLRDLEAAIRSFEQAIAVQHPWPEAHFNLGNAYRDTGRLDLAVRAFQTALQLRPHYVKAMLNLANVSLEMGRLETAERLLRSAVGIKTNYAEAYFNLGRVFRRQRRLPEAIQAVAQALHHEPSKTRYQAKLAEYYKHFGQLTEARLHFEQVLQSAPDHLEATIHLAEILRDQGQLAEALALLDAAVSRRTIAVELLWLRADVRRLLGQFDDALDDLEHARTCDTRSANVHNLMGVIQFAKGDPAAAVASYRAAIACGPDLAEAHSNLGAALQSLGHSQESREAFEMALRLKPDFPVAHLNQALCLLREGNLEQGWREFEWRFLCSEYRLPYRSLPLWAGEPVVNKTVLVQCEQGLGDTFQFVRYASLLHERGARVVVECQPAARELVANCPGVAATIAQGEWFPGAQLRIPALSLPAVFRTSLDTIPSQTPYLFANEALLSLWRVRLGDSGQLKVGIAWQGNKRFQTDQFRSVPLRHFETLADVSGVSLISLQKFDGREQLHSSGNFEVLDFGDELDRDGPFRDTAAIIGACDLVITSDTAIAHLAGALGKPVWVALSYSADWRWLAEGDACPWYPTMRLFRQPAFKDWPSVFARMAGELRRVVGGSRERLLPVANEMVAPAIRVETAPGELVDKITILEIKSQRLTNPAQLVHVHRELASLRDTRAASLPRTERLSHLTDELRTVNERLWDIEDEIRACERQQDFGARFVELARSVYVLNDQRAALKRHINAQLQSRFQEEKSYVDYRAPLPAPLAASPSPRAVTALPHPQSLSSAAKDWSSYCCAARAQARQLASQLRDSEVLAQSPAAGIPRVGVVIGHFDSPDFLRLNLACLRKHCGVVPVLVADDCSPGLVDGTSAASAAALLEVVAADPAASLWTNQQRFGHVLGDLSALAKGIWWASALKLEVLVKLSQRLIINRPAWLEDVTHTLQSSQTAALGQGCSHFGWKIRTESMAIAVPAWDHEAILQRLSQPPPRQFAEWIVWGVIEEHLGGRMAEWKLLAPSREERQDDVYFRATHRWEEYAALAQSVGLKPGNYRCAASEIQVNYQP